jgi:ABC-type nickel/cobalt efflux system permease component RcnA
VSRRGVSVALAVLVLATLLAGIVLLELRPSTSGGVERSARRTSGALGVWFERTQRSLHQALSRHLRAAARAETPQAAAFVLGLSFLYGVAHAVGPGHGKVVVASLFLGREARPLRGVATGFLISGLQVASSIALVGVLALGLGYRGMEIVDRTAGVELVSYALIIAVGLYMVGAAIMLERRHDAAAHDPDRSRPPRRSAIPHVTGAAVLAAGVTPCPSAIIVLLFALANGALAVGMVACLVMAIGMGLTVSAVGLAAIGGRRALLRPLHGGARSLVWAARGLTVLAGLGLVAVGGWLAVGAWSRLP